jgi:archaellum component FlaF (FlaF/FlaG flagellin family)
MIPSQSLRLAFLALAIPAASVAQSTLNESFESWPPLGWTLEALGAGQGFIQDWQGIAWDGDHSAYAAINNSTCDHWMVSPAIQVATSGYELRFWEIHEDVEFYVGHSVWISTGSSVPGGADFVELASWEDVPTVWTERMVDLSAFEGEQIHLAWRYQGTWHTWFVDQISVAPSDVVDAGLLSWDSPGLAVEGGATTDVQITAKNWGTTTVESAEVNWQVNGEEQVPWSQSGLSWVPGQELSIDLSSWTPSSGGFYELTATLVVDGDFEESNNSMATTVDVGSAASLEAMALTPEGMQPVVENQAVKVELFNSGSTAIDTLWVTWSVDGLAQEDLLLENANLMPGEAMEIQIGTVSLDPGLHEVEVNPHALGDATWPLDVLTNTVAVDVFWESFEGGTLGGMPDGWSTTFGIVEGANFDTPFHGDWYYTAMPDANFFGVVTDTLWTPPLSIENGDEFSFFMKKDAFLATTNLFVVEDIVTGEIQVLGPLSIPTGNYTEVSFDVSSLAGVKRMGITSAVEDFPGLCRFDYFESTASPFWHQKDLRAEPNVIPYRLPSGQPWEFECHVKNTGLSDLSGTDYSVELVRGGLDEEPEVLASYEGVDCASWETVSVPISYTFSDVEAMELSFRVILAEDEDGTNNRSQVTSAHAVPPSTVLVGAQDGWVSQPSLMVPFNSNGNTMTLGEDDISQMILRPSDLGEGGTLYGLAIHYQSLLQVGYVNTLPLQVAVSPTEVMDLSEGWIPSGNFEVLFNDTLVIHHGFDEWVYVPFDSTWSYSGSESLVFRFYQYDPSWPPSLFRGFDVQHPTGDEVLTRVAMDVYQLEVDEDIDFALPWTARADVRLISDPATVFGTLAGVVLDAGTSEPLANATVVLEGSSLTATTNAQGSFEFQDLPLGPYAITASLVGYESTMWEGELPAAGLELVLSMSALPAVNVMGQVISNESTAGLSDVALSLNVGGLIWETNTDNAGGFVFEGVFGNTAYELAASKQGYDDGMWEVILEGADTLMEPLIMIRSLLSPYDPELLEGEEVGLSWKHPQTGESTRRVWDINAMSTSYTNEPMEDVWLGNVVQLGDDTTTVLALEFQFDVYELAEDWVTAEVLSSEGEVLAASEPFLAFADTVLVIPVPQVVLTGTCFAMLHWQNNVTNVNALLMDFSDEELENVAAIAYPGEAPQLFTDYVGGGPNSAFHVRMHTYDDTQVWGEELLGFEVLRGPSMTFPDVSSWSDVPVTPLNALSVVDSEASLLEEDVLYRYAVRALYPSGESRWTFGPSFLKPEMDAASAVPVAQPRVFPNPVAAGGSVTLVGWDVATIRVVDAQGRIVKEVFWWGSARQTSSLSLRGLPAGRYEIQGEAATGMVRASVLVQ